MGGAKGAGLAKGDDAALIDQHGPGLDMAGGIGAVGKGIPGEAQDLSQQQIGHCASSSDPGLSPGL